MAKTDTADTYRDLIPFATTDRQRQVLKALVADPNQTSVAKVLGVGRTTVRDCVNQVRRHAARRGYAPEYDRTRVLPETERIKGVSTLYGPEGVEHQWVKTDLTPEDPPVPAIIDAPIVKQSVFTDRTGAVVGNWTTRKPEAQQEIDRVLLAMKEHIAQYDGAAGVTKRRSGLTLSKGLLEVYPIGDAHVGMLAHAEESGDDFDLKICRTQLSACIDLLAERAQPASRALVINVGDYFHANDNTNLTPGHKHKLDVDSRTHRVLRVGYYLMHRIIERLLQVHDQVDVWNIAGNHDPMPALALNLFIEGIFRNDPRVTVHDNAAPYQYLEFGKCMIMGAHGHLAPFNDLPGIVLARQAAMAGRTKFRHAFTGHVHHERIKELAGMTAESVRSLKPKDSHEAGRYNAGQSLQAVTFHEEYGLIDRRQVGIEMVKARLAGVL